MAPAVPYINLVYIFEGIYLVMVSSYSYAISLAETFPWSIFNLCMLLLSAILFVLLLIYLYKIYRLHNKDREVLLASFLAAKDPETEKKEEWLDITDHIESDNESQWKLALIDADKILEDALREGGYDGETIGDRLKNAEDRGGFRSLQDAWEAHKVRNRIAHESGFELTKREARRVVELYKNALGDLHFFE